jgi:hypothetical protein
MRRLRPRAIVALLCIALVLLAALTASVSSTHLTAILTPLWLLFSAVPILVLRRSADCRDEQAASLLSLVLSRAPPASLALA